MEAQIVDEITDGLGKKVDDNIKEAIIALHVNGFRTDGSCEGHVDGDHGLPYPWIDIGIPEPEGWEKSEKIKKAWRAENLSEQKRMLGILEEFYKKKETPMDVRFLFDYMGIYGSFRLQSFGAELMDLLSPGEKKEKYTTYKKEMDDFTVFLKEKYFNSN